MVRAYRRGYFCEGLFPARGCFYKDPMIGDSAIRSSARGSSAISTYHECQLYCMGLILYTV